MSIASISRRAALAGAAALLALPAAAASVHEFGFTSIEGDPLPLSQFEGRPILLVNTASRCGFTGQYEGLQTLHERYRDEGLVVLGVPSDSFRQELRDEAAVKQFCELQYGIDFPMTEIEVVKGADAHPVWRWVAEQGGEPTWNFNKVLIGRDGRFIVRFGPSVGPSSPKLLALIEEELAAE